MVAPARLIAARVLQRVASDDAWATPTLDAELRRASVKRSDAALATQIVYGSLRTTPELEDVIGRHLQRPLKVDDWTRRTAETLLKNMTERFGYCLDCTRYVTFYVVDHKLIGS